MKFVNLTPHTINVENDQGQMVAIPADGTVARVDERYYPLPPQGGFAITAACPGKIIGLPAPTEGVMFVVSAPVGLALNGARFDVVCPDTGKTAIRDDKGQTVGVRGFVFRAQA